MKKKFLVASTIFSLLGFIGFSAVVHAVAPVVSAGSAQTITLPTSTVTLTGTATATAPQVIAGYNWAQTSGPVASVIATPTTASTLVSGLTEVGTYLYTLTVTDSANVSGSATITINKNQPASSSTKNLKMKLEINPNGKVNMQGTLQSITGSILTVKVWGIVFTVNTSDTNFDGRVKDLSLYKVGDYISVKGKIDESAVTLTVNARSIKNISVQIFKKK